MPTITDVPGIMVGHAHDAVALTGCTVVLTPQGATGAVDVRGGGPATHETDLLDPARTVDVVHAITLCGGSAFGLAAAGGVMRWLHQHGYGLPTPAARVPIVPAAALYDLMLGRADRWADAAMGYAACEVADTSAAEGCVGVGIGATVGKLLGLQHAMKGGVGTWSETLADGVTVGALVVTNAFGDVFDEASGAVLAGVRHPEYGGLGQAQLMLRDPRYQPALNRPIAPQNTTLAVVATDARLGKAAAQKLAQMAHDGLPRTIRPIHTPFDGDAVFALATNQRPAPQMVVLGSVAADVLARAVERSVKSAVSLGGVPSYSELQS
jgi:L-aminopeptidase/D-esterase-like protein